MKMMKIRRQSNANKYTRRLSVRGEDPLIELKRFQCVASVIFAYSKLKIAKFELRKANKT